MTIIAISQFWVMSALAAVAGSALAEPGTPLSGRAPRIVIDPGHGGADVGARGPTGLTEKSVSLELARQLTLMLEPRYNVALTRSDDYSMDLRQRAAMANRSKADLMISLHTGAGFLHGTDGITVYYHGAPHGDGRPEPDAGETDNRNRWDRAHLRHKGASVSLAKALAGHLKEIAGDNPCKVQSLPLKLLEGVDMPAVLIEVGHITHPAAEKRLASGQGIDILSNALVAGVGQYVKAATVPGRP